MKLMKSLTRRALLATAATIAVAGAVALPAQARTLEAIKKDGKIIIATEGQYAPFNFFENKKPAGFEIEVAEALAAKMGLKVEWKALSFDALLTGLKQDRWDMVIASHGITPERAKAVTFAEPHYCSGGVVVAKDAAIKAGKDLAGKTVAVQTGTSYQENVKKVAKVKEIKNFPQDTDARAALVSGRVDAWVTDKFVALQSQQANPGSGLNMGEFLFVERIAPAVAKGNTALAGEINKALAAILADGSYEKISQKYFKEDIRCR
jgi:polar amino acid transport system substrate-binding protein